MFSLFRKETNGPEQVEILDNDRDFVGMILNLSGHHHHYRIGSTSRIFPRGRYNFFYIPKGSGMWTLEKGINAIAFIQCDPLFLPQFGREVPILNDFLRAITLNKPTSLTTVNLLIPSEALDSLSDINRDHSFSEKETRDTFLSSKLRKMFLVGLANSQDKAKKSMTDRLLTRLREVHQYIVDNIQFLRNTNALGTREEKKKFKQVFGMTVNDAIQYERAKMAEDLLLNTTMSVQDIGQRVGYKNLSGFSKAFHRRHGISPSEYRIKMIPSQKA